MKSKKIIVKVFLRNLHDLMTILHDNGFKIMTLSEVNQSGKYREPFVARYTGKETPLDKHFHPTTKYRRGVHEWYWDGKHLLYRPFRVRVGMTIRVKFLESQPA